MLKEDIEFAETNDLHFTYNQEQKYFYFDKDGKLSDHVKIGDENKFNQVKNKMKKNAN